MLLDPTGGHTPPDAFVLASASPRRRELLDALDVPFTVETADVDERLLPGEPAGSAAVRLAVIKAEVVAARGIGRLVLGADTIVVLDGRILGKPVDADEARAMLRALRGRAHAVITGVALHDTRTGRTLTAAPETSVLMRDYADWEIDASIAAGTPFDKAGAYAIQDEVFAPVAGIDGCYCNVMGLSLWSVVHLLRELAPWLEPAPPSAARAVCAECPLIAASR